MYWEDLPGRRRPAYLDLCFESVQRQATNLDLVVVGPESIFDYAPDVDPTVWAGLPGPNFRSDYARTRLLYRYGGIWIDYDLIAFRPLTELLAPLADQAIAGWGKENRGRFYAGLFAARPGSDFVRRWLEAQDDRLQQSGDERSLPWPALAQHITEPLAQELDYYSWPMRRISPVMWWEWRRFTSNLDSPSRVLSFSPYTVMLFNKVMGPRVGLLSRKDVLEGQTLLSRLLRISLGLTTEEEEESRLRSARSAGKHPLLALGPRAGETVPMAAPRSAARRDLTSSPRSSRSSTVSIRSDPPAERRTEVSQAMSRGIAWTGVQMAGSNLLSLVVFVVLGRLLTPRDFGLLASATVIVLFLRVLVDAGFSRLLVQREHLTPEHVDTAFWTAIVIGVAFSLLLAAAAPLVALTFGEPRLTNIVRALSIIFIFVSLDGTQSAMLERRMEFRSQAIRRLIAGLASATIAILLAVEGFGAWALVAQQLTLEGVTVLVLWSLSPWRPTLRFSPAVSLSSPPSASGTPGARCWCTSQQTWTTFL